MARMEMEMEMESGDGEWRWRWRRKVLEHTQRGQLAYSAVLLLTFRQFMVEDRARCLKSERRRETKNY
jgi:hypothetical protein